jgi:ubiquinone biosynthesis accessory factor UbiJ
MLIKPIFAGLLETALNRYLHLDPDAGLFLAPLAGKVVAVNVTPFDWTLYLCPTPESIQVLESYAGIADTTLSGSPFALGLMSVSGNPMQSAFSGQVHIAGDVHTGRAFQQLFEKLHVDMEEQVSHVTGDVIAHQIGRLLRGGQRWGHNVVENLRMDIAEFLHDESRDLPPAPELEIFFRKIDALRNDYDRLQARLERLEKTLSTAPENR